MRNFLGHIVRDKVLIVILSKEDPPNVYKNEFESDKLSFNGYGAFF
jgi:hypothetical protein